MRKTLPGVALIAAATATVPVQQAPLPSFEVASVRLANPEVLQHRGFGCGAVPSGHFEGLGDMRWLIACAYGLPASQAQQQIVGVPKWAEDDLFETFPPSNLTQPQMRSMLQGLLAERFKLAAHRERKEVPGFALVVARADGRLGSQLQPTPNACADWIGSGRQGQPPMVFGDLACGRGQVSANVMRQTRAPLSQLANLLSGRVERPVEDRTGLTGFYAFDLRWSAAAVSPSSSSDGARLAAILESLPTSIFSAIQEQLGLKLEPTKTRFDFLIIDHIERPTPN